MTKTTKIILVSTGVLLLGLGSFFGVRYIARTRKKKRQEEQAKLLASMSNTTTTTTPTPKSSSTPTTTAQVLPSTLGATPSGAQIITSSGVPIVMASYTTTDPTTPTTPSYNPNSISFKKLDSKIKSLYRMLAILDRKDGKTVFIETDDFKPEKPNSEVGLSTQQIVWREAYNNMIDIFNGFNAEEKDNPTKSYGLLLLDIFKKQRLDYLFPPKTADGKNSVFSPNAKWYKDAEKNAIAKGLKTDFWKVS